MKNKALSHEPTQKWTVYIIACKANTFYTGIALDVNRRFAEHQAQAKKTAKYLRGKAPLTLVFSQLCDNKTQALKAEYYIKSLSRSQKAQIIQEGFVEI